MTSNVEVLDWFSRVKQPPWLATRTIFLTRHGSQAYGTSTPTSDLDLKGVAIAPREVYLGFLQNFEQAEFRDPFDCVVFDIRKFFKLAADCNPNIIEILFTSESDWILPEPRMGRQERWSATNPWPRIHANRDAFLSKKAKHTFSGYAIAQLKRIRTHRSYLLNPPKAAPRRQDFGLPDASTIGKEQLGLVEARIRKFGDVLGGIGLTKDMVSRYDEEAVTKVVEEVNLARELIPVIIAERRFGNACRAWAQFQKHLEERNPARAALEAKFGYDAKHAGHLVRLLRMASEILRGDGVIVKRPDAEELLAIRNGFWSFELLEAWAAEQDAALESAYAASPLPDSPDRQRLDQILVDTVSDML